MICCAFKLGFLQIIYKASLIFKSNLEKLKNLYILIGENITYTHNKIISSHPFTIAFVPLVLFCLCFCLFVCLFVSLFVCLRFFFMYCFHYLWHLLPSSFTVLIMLRYYFISWQQTLYHTFLFHLLFSLSLW